MLTFVSQTQNMKNTETTSKNKELSKMLEAIKDAQKNKQKSIVIFTTAKEHHKENGDPNGLSVNDLKPKFLEAYKHLLCNYNLSTKLVSMDDKAVEWVVTF